MTLELYLCILFVYLSLIVQSYVKPSFKSTSISKFTLYQRWGGDRGGRRKGRGSRGGHSNNDYDAKAKLNFKTTVKIDPNQRTPVEDMPLSTTTTNILLEKGFETMTPVQSQSYEYVASGVDCVAQSRTGTALYQTTLGIAERTAPSEN